MPTTVAARSASRSSRNPPRRYISTSSPPRSRSTSSRALISARRSRRRTPAAGRRGATPALARRRRSGDIDPESSRGVLRSRVRGAPAEPEQERDDQEQSDERDDGAAPREEQQPQQAQDEEPDSDSERAGHRNPDVRSSGLQNHETLLGHLADRPRRAFLRVAGRLDAPVGHLVGAERRRLVDG